MHNLRLILNLFAGFAIGIHVAVFLHEVGHALGFWISGGGVIAIVMQAPAPSGYVMGSTPDPFPQVWGGVVFGSLMTLVPLAIARCRITTPLIRFIMFMVASFCLAHNGLYLFVGGILPFGDASNMIHLGAPRSLLISLGIPLLWGYVRVLASAIRAVGLAPTWPAWKWILIVELGLLPVPALALMPLFSSSVQREMHMPMLLYVAVYAISFALAADRARAITRSRVNESATVAMMQGWRTMAKLFIVAILLIAAEWWAFRPA